MAERTHSKFQQKVIKRYYDNLDHIGLLSASRAGDGTVSI